MEKENKALSDLSIEELEEKLHDIGCKREEIRKVWMDKRNDMSKYINKWFIFKNDKEYFEFFKPLTYLKPISNDDDMFFFKGIFISSYVTKLYGNKIDEQKFVMDGSYSIRLKREDIPDMFSDEAKIGDALNYVGQVISSCQEEINKSTKID
jgi:hypothetical protein